MTIRDNKVMATLLASVVVVGGVNVAAYAGGGHVFLLGKHNTEKQTSVLQNKHKGAALQLTTKKSSPPLKVNSRKKVAHLNADAVDGAGASALRTKMWTFPVPDKGASDTYGVLFGPLPAGRYLVDYTLNIVGNNVSDAQVECDLKSGNVDVGGHILDSLYGDGWDWVSANTLVTVGPNTFLRLDCDAILSTFVVDGSHASHIHATRIDTVAKGTSTLS